MFTRIESNEFEFEGQTITLDNSFNNVLLFYEMIEDKELYDLEKLALGVEILTGIECITDGEVVQDFDWLQSLFKTLIDKLFDKQTSDDQRKVFDFEKDSELIYASFLQDYNIDLLEEVNKMSFKKFMTLIRQLSDDTPFKKAIGYRVAKVPAVTKYNKDQVEHLRSMKRFYALEEEEQANNDKAIESAFNSLKR